jgi:hypothetical protein
MSPHQRPSKGGWSQEKEWGSLLGSEHPGEVGLLGLCIPQKRAPGGKGSMNKGPDPGRATDNGAQTLSSKAHWAVGGSPLLEGKSQNPLGTLP